MERDEIIRDITRAFPTDKERILVTYAATMIDIKLAVMAKRITQKDHDKLEAVMEDWAAEELKKEILDIE